MDFGFRDWISEPTRPRAGLVFGMSRWDWPFYSSGTVFELISISSWLDIENWHHIAVCRNKNIISLYLDGNIQMSRDVGESLEFNESVDRLRIGKVDLDYFTGYLDEIRVFVGVCYWKSNFNVTTTAYSLNGQAGNKESARWVKIALLCGDGTQRNINKVGIYPNISFPYLPTGGFNCEWTPVYDRISNYVNVARNLSSEATVIGEDLIELDFEDQSLANWTNLIQTSSANVIQLTDFGGSDPNSFWDSMSENFTSGLSYYEYPGNALKIYLSDTEAGNIYFNTEKVYEDCACEVVFSHSSNVETNRLYTILRMYAESGDYYDIRRHQYSTNEQYVIYKNSGFSTYGSFYPEKGFKIERTGDSVKFYIGEPGAWSLRHTYLEEDPLKGGNVYFSFIVSKEEAYPEVICTLNSLSLYKLDAIQIDTEWGLVASDQGAYALGYKTTTVPMMQGPILEHPMLIDGVKVKYIEFYYYNSGSGGGGFSFIDSFGDEVLGVGTNSPGWLVHSASGWEVIEENLSGNMNWYRVRSTFDWDNSLVTIEWEDITTTLTSTFVKELIKTTDVAKLQIMGTLGVTWGMDFLDIKFDNIVISPLVDYLYTFVPSNCLTGNKNNQGFENCWGFPATLNEPTLVIDLGDFYRVDKFVMYSRPFSDSYDNIVNSFDIYGSTSSSGIFDLLIEEVGFSENFYTPGNNVYRLTTPVEIKFVKLVIKEYTKPVDLPSVAVKSRDGTTEYITLDGGFVREFEIWQCPDSEMLNSEDHPIVCMDLKDQFNLTYHKVEGPGIRKGVNYDWSNENQFYQFSSDSTDNPNQVAFSQSYDYSVPFSYPYEFLIEYGDDGTFTLETDVFLNSGHYDVLWSTYKAVEKYSITIVIIGLEIIEISCENTGDSWVNQSNEFQLSSSGYYNIQIRADLEANLEEWGVKNISFKNFDYTSKWVAVRRNTAQNFVWDTSSHKPDIDNIEGIDSLQFLKLYADGKHRPTEYWWMWESYFCTFENDTINTKVGRRSLKINCPASTNVDVIKFLEGDCFGHDENFSIKDSLSFWFYIEDIDKLYLEEGGFMFGSVVGYYVEPVGNLTDDDYYDNRYNPTAKPAVYIWKFKDLALETGWNYIRLKFDQYFETIPEAYINTGKLPTELDFREHVTSSFGMIFQGTGEAFYMLLDGIKIERNWFYDELSYGDHGLCLTWKDYAEIPLSGVDTRYGTIEMWVKLYSSTAGVDHFNNTASRTLFTLVDTDNNSISLSIRSSSWFEIGVGDTKSKYRTLFIDPTKVAIGNAAFSIDDILHIALVWSNNSEQLDGNDTMRLYVNGELYLNGRVTWDTGDSKNVVLRLGGGNTYLANNDDTDGSAIFSNVKFYNYCKTEFEINQQAPTDIDNLTPNKFVQVSKDDIEFFTSKSSELPLTFDQVQPGEKIPVYVRVDKSKIDELDKFTGSINVEWEVPV